MSKIVDSEKLGPSGNGSGRDFLFGYQKEIQVAIGVIGLIGVGLLAARIIGLI